MRNALATGRPPTRDRKPTDLDRWFALNPKIGVPAFAERVGVSVSRIWYLRSGHARPSLATASKIEKETGGEVLATSWAPSTPKPRARKAARR